MDNPLGIKDAAHRLPDGTRLDRFIEGTIVRDRPAILTRHGATSELFSESWGLPTPAARHVIFVALKPSAVSAWHRHAVQTDHIAVVDGMLKVVVFDPRPESPTHGQVDVHHLGAQRPSLVVIPPGVWHGIANMLPHAFSSFVNLFDQPYRHGDPDEWRLPVENSVIPYRFDTV